MITVIKTPRHVVMTNNRNGQKKSRLLKKLTCKTIDLKHNWISSRGKSLVYIKFHVIVWRLWSASCARETNGGWMSSTAKYFSLQYLRMKIIEYSSSLMELHMKKNWMRISTVSWSYKATYHVSSLGCHTCRQQHTVSFMISLRALCSVRFRKKETDQTTFKWVLSFTFRSL
jgi:hypothetical protein